MGKRFSIFNRRTWRVDWRRSTETGPVERWIWRVVMLIIAARVV